jgi:hypothetical protein
MFCLGTRFVALDYCAVPGLAFYKGIDVQGDSVKQVRRRASKVFAPR